MSFLAVAHAEWIKIRSVRASYGSLIAVFAATVTVTLLVYATVGRAEAEDATGDALFNAFYAMNFAQIAAISFGATAVSSEYLSGALRVSLGAVPRRSLFYLSKMTVIGGSALLTGVLTSFASFLTGQAFLGEYALDLGEDGAVRACFGGGIYLSLMALLAAGLTVLLRSAVAVLSMLIPFILIVSMVVGDMSGNVADFLPDRAGQQILYGQTEGSLGPWTGLAVCACWSTAALLAGWWALRSRDA
ncbi:ABC transporter permease [Streptomyces sp. NA04227]|uniref:ABC transporter permease n=1 Tax=Streptomyces sp. NA04227 TaxID=2742136 RepID=UPI0015910AF2|nr:ABC transporter permease [Streptomyces sp. NA04227]QKW05319.1 ABC transporter permease [Streptomyces sp. NA04227]